MFVLQASQDDAAGSGATKPVAHVRHLGAPEVPVNVPAAQPTHWLLSGTYPGPQRHAEDGFVPSTLAALSVHLHVTVLGSNCSRGSHEAMVTGETVTIGLGTSLEASTENFTWRTLACLPRRTRPTAMLFRW